MSSEALGTEARDLFIWHDGLDRLRYLEATFYIETALDPELAALGIAREQSACCWQLPREIGEHDFTEYTARVVRIELLEKTDQAMLRPYSLKTSVYPQTTYGKVYQCAKATIAFPIVNFGDSLVNMLNSIGGEVMRLGFINAAKLLAINLPEHYSRQFRGPRHGMKGIREKLQVFNRPLFCRSNRPAVGLTIEKMLKINEAVLRGGFDVVKDDELTNDTPCSPFKQRVDAMVALKQRVEDATGERKMYVANILDHHDRSLAMADYAAKQGADAVLISLALQGLTFASEVAEKSGLVVLAHNSWDDVWHRHPRFGTSSALFLQLCRLAGADLVMLPGEFTTPALPAEEVLGCVNACARPLAECPAVMPIIAGGKLPQELASYRAFFHGSPDFMIIAATVVDNHPQGLEAGARAFREAWETIARPASAN